jgi:hypothetical protein
MLFTLNFIDAKIQETTEVGGKKWRSNKSGRVGKIIINLNFVMISLTLKFLILYKNEDTYIGIKAIRSYKKFLLLLLKNQFYNLFFIFSRSILLCLMQNLRFSQ